MAIGRTLFSMRLSKLRDNVAEAVMRDLATGRKNFLFSGSDESAKNLAFAYSLTQSCKLCNVNPYDYWEDLLTNSCNPTRTIDSFMPLSGANNHNTY